MTKIKTLTTPSAEKIVKYLELPCTAGGNTKYYNHFGIQLGNCLKCQTCA